jgi:hypothetical protein
VLAEWVRFLMGLSVLCGIGCVLGLPCQRVGDVSPAGEADAVVVLLMVAGLLLPVEPSSLGSGACRAVRRAAVPQTAAAHRSRQVRAHSFWYSCHVMPLASLVQTRIAL